VTWTEDASSGEMVTLVISATKVSVSDGVITCVVPDSAETVTVDSSLLGEFSNGDFVSVVLSRAATSMASDTNATIYLIGGVSSSGTGTITTL
jgi:pyruvoyl-dependent arginine decarboxylase (PvlArgDC)